MVTKKKIMPTINTTSTSPVMKYVMITLLVVLLAFAVAYIYNIQKQAMKQKENFENDKYKVVFVHSKSCGHCTSFAPTFARLTSEMAGNSKYELISVERADAGEYMKDVSAFPTVLVYSPSGAVKVQTGNVPLDALRDFVASSS
jgi:thiol-disulfide isomerase/thioredoxin